MIKISDLVSKYTKLGYSLAVSQNLAAEEIVLRKISASDMVDKIALKGGIVLFNLSHNSRRATRDIDFDFIHHSIDDESIRIFISKLNQNNDGFRMKIHGFIKQLHQEDYQGVRVNVLIVDSVSKTLSLKMDIGVHVYLEIDQQNISFSFLDNGKNIFLQVNPIEQIFAEKMLSLARLGPISTRYKDIYDMYYLSTLNEFDEIKLKSIFASVLDKKTKGPNDLLTLRRRIGLTLNNDMFVKQATSIVNKWIDVDFEDVKKKILNILDNLLID